ncbi:uncharacterized protein LOC122963613 [Acropora millepora]|uniref:uncharacterized protein LOC122963613 n=1 Tax=Acropora millepora TaxID=45264 RepID=UPI001CF3541A|nr:uncharacterized protein LOC122963613 [Acropora millepora]
MAARNSRKRSVLARLREGKVCSKFSKESPLSSQIIQKINMKCVEARRPQRLTISRVISESYGKDMGLDSKVSIVFPYQMTALLNAMGMIWNFTKGHSNPIENQIRYTRVIMGMVWDYCIPSL